MGVAKRACSILVPCWLIAAMIVATGTASARAADASWGFVTRSGSDLMLDGKPFRFSGANIEWLGLVGYGPLNFEPGQTMRFPTSYEVNDALATAQEMGATVVRAQTLGDTVGCANCLEPALGHYNPHAFRVMDYAIARARAYGIRLILEFDGDSRAVNGYETSSVYSNWEGGKDFSTDPTVISAFEDHIKHIVDHVNSYTGIPYKDDPTILGWMDCNFCTSDTWVTTIDDYVKSLGPKQLVIDNDLVSFSDSKVLDDPNIDAFSTESYPHSAPEVSGDRFTGEDPHVHLAANKVTSAGKVFFVAEFGWDPTNWLTTSALQTFLTGIEQDPNISGDLWWALEGHTDGHGWKPVPANSDCLPPGETMPPPSAWTALPQASTPAGGAGCQAGEDGSWWALYYTGIDTASNTAADMAARAQLLRAHAYAMSGFATTPAHETVPAPVITSTDAGKVVFEGAAGSPTYSVQKRSGATWATPCDRCTTDAAGGWTDPGTPGCYRVVGYNLDGVAGPPSAPAGSGCPKTAAVAPSTCRSTRSIRYTVPIGARSVRVTVDGKRRTLRRRGRTLLLSLNGLLRRAVTVRITWRQHGHRHVRASLLHPCTTNRESS